MAKDASKILRNYFGTQGLETRKESVESRMSEAGIGKEETVCTSSYISLRCSPLAPILSIAIEAGLFLETHSYHIDRERNDQRREFNYQGMDAWGKGKKKPCSVAEEGTSD